LRTGGHVRIDVTFPYLARGLRRTADVLAQLLMAVFAGLISWKIWALVIDSMETDARSSTYLLTPLWVPQGILGIGFSLLALAALFGAIAILAGWESTETSAGPQA
jgi:TRAP-type C4-dicarboxylate transport system permease small subunit